MKPSDDLEVGFTVALAREMRDGDRIFTGGNQIQVALAAYLARRLWAPGLRLWASGGPRLDGARDTEAVGRGQFDHLLVHRRDAFWWQSRAFDEMGVRSAVCFAGGLQVDAYGNANLEGIPEGDGWRLRGPGSAGLPDLTAWAERFYIIVPQHTSRVLVPECARVSVVGNPTAREAVGWKPDALEAVITPLARFEPTRDGLVLTELTDGFDMAQVAEATGFPLRTTEHVRTRPSVTEEEREALAVLQRAAERNRRGQ